MIPFCAGTLAILRRVERIINEQTGRIMCLPGDCILLLHGVSCSDELSSRRLFCPRDIYPYGREIWLKRVGTRFSVQTLAPDRSK